MEVKKIPARGETVEVTITFTAEEWQRINEDAGWSGMSVEAYLKAAPARRGC